MVGHSAACRALKLGLTSASSADTPTDARHCVNSVSIKFDPNKDMKYEGPTKKAKA